jgi:indolepyruvate ferredoxin oxidoreductase
MTATVQSSVTLDDKYLRDEGRVYMTGVQALVRLLLVQRRLDRSAGLNTAGFVSGYRGSPLGTLDHELWRAGPHLAAHDITFVPGLNEDLAATAVWGTQQIKLFPGARREGVFGMWYAKSPGVDRSGDALRHANYAGTAALGGVLALAGDDHACKSASLPSQSDWAFRDACIPILNPTDVAEVLSLGILGFAMSRFSGLWIGMKCLADIMDSSASVSAAETIPTLELPSGATVPPDDVSIRWPHAPLDKERLVFDVRLPRAVAFARANGVNQVVRDDHAPRFGIVAVGKSNADVAHALRRLGALPPLRVVALGMPWPLDGDWLAEKLAGLERVLVVEEKRSLVEEQLAHALYHLPADRRPALLGKSDLNRRPLLPATGALSLAEIEAAIAHLIGRADANESVVETTVADYLPKRLPYFCSGCPHNRSTKVPKGSLALAGIGCHYMAQWMDRETLTFTQMGGEGSTWIGIAPHTSVKHVFANLGDGTYAHSGLLAIRAAIAAGVTLTYKLLYNDAVAMTGGQPAEGGFTVPQIAAQLLAEGVKAIEVVAEEPMRYRPGDLPAGVRVSARSMLAQAEERLRETTGVTVIIYDQVCAAEKRRRRKRGLLAEAPRRVVINEEVCEGCGDCGRQSNCVSIAPVETPFGRKRRIDQTSCNQDLTCLEGFCPAFVTIEGARLGARSGFRGEPPAAPHPARIVDRASIIIEGIGGTGIVTVGALLGMAAHLEGKAVSVLDMIGLAQKGGAVSTHVRIGPAEDAPPIRIGPGEADLLLGCDLLGAARVETLALLGRGAGAVINTAHAMTGDFAAKPDLSFPEARMRQHIRDKTDRGATLFLDASAVAESVLGDTAGANVLVVGIAWQYGLIPLGERAIRRAIELNGVAVAANLRAFAWGRAIANDPALVDALLPPPQPAVEEMRLDALVAHRSEHLEAYQDKALAARYRTLVERVRVAEERAVPGARAVTSAVARSYYKLLAYKDEYEVARLLSDRTFVAAVKERFGGRGRLSFHLAPPFLPGCDPVTGRPRKRRFGPWALPLLRMVARMKGLRGTVYDPFGRTAERRAERALIRDYEALADQLLLRLNSSSIRLIADLLGLPEAIRGFGPVKEQSMREAAMRRQELLARLDDAATRVAAAE